MIVKKTKEIMKEDREKISLALSKELAVGDVIFFKHADNKGTHAVISKFNEFFGSGNKEDWQYVHAEVVIGFEQNGQAIIASARGGKDKRVTSSSFLDYLNRGSVLPDSIRIHRADDLEIAQKIAKAGQEICKRSEEETIKYSLENCLKASIPHYFGKQSPPKTIVEIENKRAKGLICSQFCRDAIGIALEGKKAPLRPVSGTETLGSIVATGTLSRALMHHRYFSSKEIDISMNESNDKKRTLSLDIHDEFEKPTAAETAKWHEENKKKTLAAEGLLYALETTLPNPKTAVFSNAAETKTPLQKEIAILKDDSKTQIKEIAAQSQAQAKETYNSARSKVQSTAQETVNQLQSEIQSAHDDFKTTIRAAGNQLVQLTDEAMDHIKAYIQNPPAVITESIELAQYIASITERRNSAAPSRVTPQEVNPKHRSNP